MRIYKGLWMMVPVIYIVSSAIFTTGCTTTEVNTSSYAQGPAPLRDPSPAASENCSYEDSLTGGQIFSMYCSYCHNAPSLAERPYSQFRNVAAHMRVRANLTGKEYAKLMEWLRRWHDVPPQTPPDTTTPKRLTFSQPIAELRPQEPEAKPEVKPEAVPVPAPAPKQP